MKILLTNDDGIKAPGLVALAQATLSMVPLAEVLVVAPKAEMSQCGHRITTASSLQVIDHSRDGNKRYAVDGTPADCVRIALFALNFEPDVVFSGINRGGNLGQDLYVSGTAAAAREAAYHGVPALALSHYMRRELEVDWEKASGLASSVIRGFCGEDIAEGFGQERGFWNANLPHLDPEEHEAPIIDCSPSQEPLPVGFKEQTDGSFLYEADYQGREREPGSDIDHCFGGAIARSWIPLHG